MHSQRRAQARIMRFEMPREPCIESRGKFSQVESFETQVLVHHVARYRYGMTAVASSSILPGASSRSLTKIMLMAG